MTFELMCVWGRQAYEWIPYEFDEISSATSTLASVK
jgi:hypothetical protein